MNTLIVGGGYAGVACALRLGRNLRRLGIVGRVCLVDPSGEFVERIRLHQAATGQKLAVRDLRPLLRRAGVDFVQARVQGIDLQRRRAEIDGKWVSFDRLVLATGSSIAAPKGAREQDGVDTLDPDRVQDIARRLRALPADARVVVVGNGLTGIELATELRAMHPRLRVSLVGRGRIAEDWSPSARHVITQHLASAGIDSACGVEVLAVEPGTLKTTAGTRGFDVCLWTAGFRVGALASNAGLEADADGRVRVDPALRAVSHPFVYVAGDLASPAKAPGDPLPRGCKSAMPMGVHVAECITRDMHGLAPSAFDFATPFYCLSLGRAHGLVQFPTAARPQGGILQGRLGAWFKECICKGTWWSLVLESRGVRATVWMRTGRAPALAAAGRVEGGA